MRIALVVPGFSASEDDWCIPALLTLVRRLAPEVDVEIFAMRYPPERRDYSISGARVHAMGGGRTRGWRKVSLFARSVRAVVAAHRARPFHVLHALWADEPGAVAVTAARLLRRRAVVSVMGGELVDLPAIDYGTQRSRAGRVTVRRALRRAAVVTAGSAAMVASVHATAARHARRVPLGVDVDRFHPEGVREHLAGERRLLHVGSLTPVKDHQVLLDALRDVRRNVPVQLHVVGDGPLRETLRGRSTQAGLEACVTWHGAVPHDRLPPYYRAADAVVLTSRFESQSMVALEAAACGTPLVGSAVGILPELHGTPVVPPGDPAALARAILRLLGDEAARTDLGSRLRGQVEGALSVEHTVHALKSLYSELRQT